MTPGTPFTPETAAKARETIDRQRATYRQDYLDDDYWLELAKNLGVRLPPYYSRPSDQDIKHWLRLCKVPYHQFVDAFGWENCEEFERLNPTHGMKILAGLILELKEENERIRKIAEERLGVSEVAKGKTVPKKPKLYAGKSKAARKAEDKQNL